VWDNRHVGTTLSDEFATVNLPGGEAESLIKKAAYLHSVNNPSMKYGPMIDRQ
jgi:hypothetical protein